MDRDAQESFVRIGPNWIQLETYRDQRTARKETLGAIVFLTLLSVAAFLMLWGTP